MEDAARERFRASAEAMAARTLWSVEQIAPRLRDFAHLRGDERALDAGTGTGTFALALAASVREVVGLDPVSELLAHAQRLAAGRPNVRFVEGDASALPFPDGSFDVVTCARTLHHVARPGPLLAELGRVTTSDGTVVVVDQLAAADPSDAARHDAIERLRDPSHQRTLAEEEIGSLLKAAGLTVEALETKDEDRELDSFLDLAACTGPARDAAVGEVARLVSAGEDAGIALRRAGDGYAMTVPVGWFRARFKTKP